MRKSLLAAILAAGSLPSFGAEQAPPAQQFIPFTITQADASALEASLNEMPYKNAAPIMQFLLKKEFDAQQAAKQVDVGKRKP